MTYYLGIDIGAARTSAAVARAGMDDVEPVDLGDGGCGVASVLHLGADGTLDVGETAERWANDEPDRVVRGFPGRIGDDVPMLLAGEPWAPEELTAWLVRWVVDRVAEREDGPAAAVAVTRPATWDADRTELLAGALAEQDIDATFLTTARAVERLPAGSGRNGQVASAAACGAARALRADGTGSDGADDVVARLAALARLPDIPASRALDDYGGDPDDGLAVPAQRSHRSGGWAVADRTETPPVDGSGVHGTEVQTIDGSGAHRTETPPVDGSGGVSGVQPVDGPGAHPEVQPDDSPGAHRTETPPVGGSGGVSGVQPVDGPGAHPEVQPDDSPGAHRVERPDVPDAALLVALGGFTGTLGATNTAGLLSGYTPPSGMPASGQATALVTEAGEQLVLPAQRSGSGRWAAVPEAADDELEADAAPAPAKGRERSPAALVSIGGAAAAVAVVATLFLWPAPRTTNSAISRPVPLVPALTSPAEPTVEPTLTPTATPTTTNRARPASTRTRRPAAPPPALETTPAPTVSIEPTEPPATTSQPPSESTAPLTTTREPDDD